jgi:hypothetical protein
MAWQTIHAAGDPRITLDIPAGVDQETSIDAKKGQLMAFFATAGDEDLDCFLLRSPYAKKFPQKRFSAALHKSMSGYCSESGANISGWTSLLTEPVTSSGIDAVACASVYTNSKEKKPGMVDSVLAVPAPKAIYTLICHISATDQDSAQASWMVNWHDDIGHLQSSLVLPDAEK